MSKPITRAGFFRTILFGSSVPLAATGQNSRPSAEEAWALATGSFSVEGQRKYDAALSKLIESYTTAYNAGRKLNDARYDELLETYGQMPR